LAHKIKLEAMARNIEKACACLAPGGQTQELGLSAVYFVLKYSHALLDQIVSKLDAAGEQHQLIAVE
jgi:hypothetical protein